MAVLTHLACHRATLCFSVSSGLDYGRVQDSPVRDPTFFAFYMSSDIFSDLGTITGGVGSLATMICLVEVGTLLLTTDNPDSVHQRAKARIATWMRRFCLVLFAVAVMRFGAALTARHALFRWLTMEGAEPRIKVYTRLAMAQATFDTMLWVGALFVQLFAVFIARKTYSSLRYVGSPHRLQGFNG